MSTKAFVLLLVGVLVLGGSLGGAFAGGMALGNSQGEAEEESTQPLSSSLGQQSSGQFSQAQADQFQQRLESGQLSTQDMDQLRQQMQGQFGEGAAGGMGLLGQGGLAGTIEAIEGGTLTVNTAQGPLRATIGADTIIQQFTVGALADLLEGMQVTVTGQRAEDGTVEATSVLVVPEGEAGFPGGRFFPRDRQQRDLQSP